MRRFSQISQRKRRGSGEPENRGVGDEGRATRDRGLAKQAVDLLRGFEQVEFAEPHRDLALRLCFQGGTRGADTAITAKALAVASAGARLEFVTADEAQSRVVETESRTRSLGVRVVRLPA